MNKSRLLRIYFAISVGVAVFLAGFVVAMRVPENTLAQYQAVIDDWTAYPKHNLRIEPEKFLWPANDIYKDMVVDGPQPGAYPGQTFITGFFGDKPGIELIDMKGKVLHRWRTSYREIWADSLAKEKPSHLENRPGHDWDSQIHGAILYPNGDVVFNFQYSGLVRIDRCSRVIWKLPYNTNHSVFEDEHGNLWIPMRRLHRKPLPQYSGVPAPFHEEYILEVSPDGKMLKELSLLDVIYSGHEEGLLFANGRHGLSIKVPSNGDFTHLNDVEVLSSQLAPAFPMFKAGDALVSLRNLNLLMVLDPQTKQIKWSMVGPFIRAHDPDFEPTGRISLFDNRVSPKRGKVRGGSRILEIDPATRQVTTVFGGRPDQFFYTARMGDHERLPNGNILITNTETGQVFEVTANGQVVWSFVNRWQDKSVAWIERAIRYPEGYMRPVGAEECK